MNSKKFHLGDLLSVTTGEFFSSGTCDLVNYMTGLQYSSSKSSLARGVIKCKPYLIEQHPWLSRIEVPDWVVDEDTFLTFIRSKIVRWGEIHDVAPVVEWCLYYAARNRSSE